MLIVTLGNGPHPVGRITGHCRDLGGGYPPGQQANYLPVAAADGIIDRRKGVPNLKSTMWLKRKSSKCRDFLYSHIMRAIPLKMRVKRVDPLKVIRRVVPAAALDHCMLFQIK
jgi:hypothetical protein